MFHPLSNSLFFTFKLHARTSEAVVVAEVVLRIFFLAEPTELKSTFFTGHMVAAI